MEGREVKDRLYEHFAQVAKATASPARIELLELVAQAERSVDALAGATGMGVTNTSAHLQVLRRAGLVETRKDGTKVFYR
ncbi:MAG: ArsR/SmtB family transcription factor, partial [Acidimicrobiales bacterium]